jgi:DNA invertase Pin-like site-specific DNA recombinase
VKLTPHQIAEAIRRRDAGEPLTEIARSYNVSHSTISRLPAEAGRPTAVSRSERNGRQPQEERLELMPDRA